MDKLTRYAIILALLLALVASCKRPSPVPSIYVGTEIHPDGQQLLTITPSALADWTAPEILTLRSLWIGSLPPPPVNPATAVADDARAAELGHHLFFDPRFSANNQVSCATCHIPEQAFTDGLPTAHGTRPNNRHTMTIIGAAYAPWLLWDGHKDSLWAQAVEPIEAVDEQGTTRLQAIHLLANDEDYAAMYEGIFGPLPDLADYGRFPDAGGPVDFLDYRERWETMTAADQDAASRVFANMGKAIAAYERRINPGLARFDAYVQALLLGDEAAARDALTSDEVAGLRIFIGRGGCITCHNGPLFSDFQFHNTGVPAAEDLPLDMGRADGIVRVLADEFNCIGQYSDIALAARSVQCNVAHTTQSAVQAYAFRTPMLRTATETAPYMHAGQLSTLRNVLEHYRRAPDAPAGKSELRPLDLSDAEIQKLAAFLESLRAALPVPSALLSAPTK